MKRNSSCCAATPPGPPELQDAADEVNQVHASPLNNGDLLLCSCTAQSFEQRRCCGCNVAIPSLQAFCEGQEHSILMVPLKLHYIC